MKKWACWGIERKSRADPFNEGWSGPLGKYCFHEPLPTHADGMVTAMFATRDAARRVCRAESNHYFAYRPVRLRVTVEALR